MCRNIKRLRRAAPPVTANDIEEAARNLVRKISGFREPSGPNRDVFEQAVAVITAQSGVLLAALPAKVSRIPEAERKPKKLRDFSRAPRKKAKA